MKIGIDASLMDENNKFGIEIYQTHLVNELAKIDPKNEYFLLFRSLRRRGKDLPGPNQSNFHKIALRIPNGLVCDFNNKIWSEFLIPKFIKKEQIDVFHALCTSFSRKKYPCKVIVTIHDLIHKYVERGKRPKYKYALESFERSIMNSDGIITVSHNTKNDILKYYSVLERRIYVTYLGVKPSIFHIPQEEIERQRLQKNIPKKFIIYLGYFLPHKNIERLIESFSIVKAKHGIEHKLLLIGGKGFSRPFIETLIDRLRLKSEVFIIDYISNNELNLFLNAADLFLFPSLYEGFGLPVLESMAVGTPVVCSNTSSLPEITGGAALLVDPLNKIDIAEAIWKLINDYSLKEDLIKKGFDWVKKFSWENTAQETLKAYRDFMQN